MRRERAYLGGFYCSNVSFFILSHSATDDMSQRAEILKL